MMRVLFTATPSSGHLHPLVPLAQALSAAGHEVAFAGAASVCRSMASLGFRTFQAGLDRHGDGDPELDLLKERARRLPQGFEITQLGVADVIYGVRARRMVPGLTAICRAWAPDVIVRECFEAGGAVVGDLLGIPHASVEITPLFDLSPMGDAIQAQLARARAETGLAPAPAMLHRYLSLCFAPPSLLDPAVPLPATLHTLRPSFFDRSGDEDLPRRISRLPPQPIAYVTIGTVANRWRSDARDLLSQILAGLRDEPLNLVVTLGRDGNPADLGAQPENILVERYIPQTLLLPLCDVCLSHAGFNTVMGALDAGLPQVFVPLLADHPCIARRCAALGLGRVVEPDELTPALVRDAVRTVLREPSYRANVQRLREEMHRLPGLERAVDLLQRLAAERVPQPGSGGELQPQASRA